ncbi:uncharacterized protein znf839.S isoform X2 [Xenopus laevis]|uniref:Uncharacterized protein znf839.S isoform X2 n=1 Tax=Xenopus laevis TaxID=8355 RepID=A0A8J1LMA9_XENLA|nr:uncharacterized protein znf839.S isoform X2 [Xenopus laevis]
MAAQQLYSIAKELAPGPEEYAQVQRGSEVVTEKTLPQGISDEVGGDMTQAGEVYYLQPDGSLVQGSEIVNDAGLRSITNSRAGNPTIKDAARQLQAAAQHVALGELKLNSLPPQLQLLNSIQFELPDVQQLKTEDQAVDQDTPIEGNLHTHNSNLLGGRMFPLKTQAEHRERKHELDSAIQILVQQPYLSEKHKAKDTNKKTLNPVTLLNSQNCSVSVARTASKKKVSCNTGKLQKKDKCKKPLKVKTRSGRISRPPMHKAKDYKFIKTGTLAHSSPSDSDDYSELSAEDEDRKKENVSFAAQSFTVQHTLFQCETCEKSYMGKGGLLRHYRLYPSHGQMQSSEINVSMLSGNEAEKRLLEAQKSQASHLSKGPVCRGRQRRTGRCVSRLGRPKKLLNSLSSYSDKQLKTAKFKEFLQQYEEGDLKELVLPCLTKFVSVYDFLLSKVKGDYPGKSSFPFIYKEFEQLHSMVKLLAQDYLANSLKIAEASLEIKDDEVAESLGIKRDITGQYSTPDMLPSECKTRSEMKQKHKPECLDEDMLPPLKVPKVEGNVSEFMEESGIGEMFSSITDAGQANEKSSEELFDTTAQVEPQDHFGGPYWTKAVSRFTSQSSPKSQVESSLQENTKHAVGSDINVFEDHILSKDSRNSDSEPSECFLSNVTNASSFDQAVCELDKCELSFHDRVHADPVYNPEATEAMTSEETVCLNQSETEMIEAFQVEPAAELLQATIINIQEACLDGKCTAEHDNANHSGARLTCGADGIEQTILHNTEGDDLSNCEYQAESIILTNTGTTDIHIETIDTIVQMETDGI